MMIPVSHLGRGVGVKLKINEWCAFVCLNRSSTTFFNKSTTMTKAQVQKSKADAYLHPHLLRGGSRVQIVEARFTMEPVTTST